MNLDFYKDRKVLITGHTGFKGSWMCKDSDEPMLTFNIVADDSACKTSDRLLILARY